MAYRVRDITDRIATGDDCFYIEPLPDGRYRLIPAPDSVTEQGTPVNKELLQSFEDRIVRLMNSVFSVITTNPFDITFDTLDGLTVTGVWNVSSGRIEC